MASLPTDEREDAILNLYADWRNATRKLDDAVHALREAAARQEACSDAFCAFAGRTPWQWIEENGA